MMALAWLTSTSASDRVRPGERTLVESDMNRATPSAAKASKPTRSNDSPSRGCSSIFQSPVCTMAPCSDRRTKPEQSGMECVTRRGSHSKGPSGKRWRMPNVLNREPSPHRLYSISRRLTSCMAKGPAWTGVPGSRAGRTQGRAPMWSSWPCVM